MKFNRNFGFWGIGRKRRSDHTMWRIVGGAALAAAGVGLIRMLPDIRRYIRISTM